MSTAGDDTYRVERLRRRLAEGEMAESGVWVEERGDAVLLSGTVADAGRRDAIKQIAEEEMGSSTPIMCDLAIAGAAAPDDAEELP